MSEVNKEDAEVKLARALYADPEARLAIEEHAKRLFPTAPTPNLDLKREREAIRAEFAKEREEFRAERLKAEQASAKEQARRALVQNPKLGVSEDDLPAIEKLMEDELIGSHAAAAEVYAARRSVAGDNTHRPFSPNMDVPGVRGAGGDEFKGILEDRDNWARNKAAEVLAEFQHGRR